MASPFQKSQNPAIIPLRPLDKGMILNISPTAIPVGGCLDAGNYVVGQLGPVRRSGLTETFSSATLRYYPGTGFCTFRNSAGDLYPIVFDTKFLYKANISGLTPYYWEYAATTGRNMKTSGLFLVGSGTGFLTQHLLAGDEICITSGATVVTRLVSTIDSAKKITMSSSTTVGASYSTSNRTIRRAMKATNPYRIDWTITTDDKLLIADSARPLYSFDGSTFTEYDTALTFIPSCVVFHNDRVFCGHTVESAADNRQRTRWSKVLDLTDFGSASEQFVDRPYYSGELKRLMGLGPMLIAYYGDGIDVGRSTNVGGDTLPISYEKFDTGGIGLYGPRALVRFLDGHFFVGTDDIYFFSTSGGLQRIGSPVVKRTINLCSYPYLSSAIVDPGRSRICFTFPEATKAFSKVWSFDYKARAWSYDEIVGDAIGYMTAVPVSWDSLGTYAAGWTNMTYFASWAAIGAAVNLEDVFIARTTGKISRYSYGLTGDYQSQLIPCVYETGDFDFGDPDSLKTFVRASIKIDRELTTNLSFAVFSSNDRGINWKSLGVSTIPAGEDECFVNFRATGSTGRFKITSSSAVPEYGIEEIVMKVKGRALESHFGPTD